MKDLETEDFELNSLAHIQNGRPDLRKAQQALFHATEDALKVIGVSRAQALRLKLGYIPSFVTLANYPKGPLSLDAFTLPCGADGKSWIALIHSKEYDPQQPRRVIWPFREKTQPFNLRRLQEKGDCYVCLSYFDALSIEGRNIHALALGIFENLEAVRDLIGFLQASDKLRAILHFCPRNAREEAAFTELSSNQGIR